jgi:Predicted enzyme with a TIM-barrel fold
MLALALRHCYSLVFSELVLIGMTQTPERTFLLDRIEGVRTRIRQAAQRSNRSPDEIMLVAVSKTHPIKAIQDALTEGLTDFGENRVQEAETKIPVIGREIAKWHLIGHLQSNKARRAVELFDVIQSLDSAALARDWIECVKK